MARPLTPPPLLNGTAIKEKSFCFFCGFSELFAFTDYILYNCRSWEPTVHGEAAAEHGAALQGADQGGRERQAVHHRVRSRGGTSSKVSLS